MQWHDLRQYVNSESILAVRSQGAKTVPGRQCHERQSRHRQKCGTNPHRKMLPNDGDSNRAAGLVTQAGRGLSKRADFPGIQHVQKHFEDPGLADIRLPGGNRRSATRFKLRVFSESQETVEIGCPAGEASSRFAGVSSQIATSIGSGSSVWPNGLSSRATAAGILTHPETVVDHSGPGAGQPGRIAAITTTASQIVPFSTSPRGGGKPFVAPRQHETVNRVLKNHPRWGAGRLSLGGGGGLAREGGTSNVGPAGALV